MLINTELIAWAAENHGLISLEAWSENGRSATSFRRCLRSGLLVRVAPGVVALPGLTVGPVQRIAAGVLSFGPEVIVSHRSAAWLWGAPVPDDHPVDLITRLPSQRTTSKGFVFHRPDDRARLRSSVRRELPVTAPLRTIRDVAAVDAGLVQGVLEALLRGRHTTVAAVRKLCARPGVRGVVAIRNALDRVTIGGQVTDSELERAVGAVFARAGATGWVFHDKIEGYEVDFSFRSERLVVEVDGWASHGALRTQWERDRERDLVLAARGWLVLRLTWPMVTRRPAAAAARLSAALAGRRPAGPSVPM